MASAADISGQAFLGGSATFMARIIGASGAAIVQADIASIVYTVYVRNQYSKDRTPVTDHTAVALTPVSSYIWDTLQNDAIWTVDDIGYNFRHVLDVTTHQAFETAGTYLVEYKLTPVSGQVIIVRFGVTVI